MCLLTCPVAVAVCCSALLFLLLFVLFVCVLSVVCQTSLMSVTLSGGTDHDPLPDEAYAYFTPLVQADGTIQAHNVTLQRYTFCNADGQPNTNTNTNTKGHVCSECFVCALCVLCVCVSPSLVCCALVCLMLYQVWANVPSISPSTSVPTLSTTRSPTSSTTRQHGSMSQPSSWRQVRHISNNTKQEQATAVQHGMAWCSLLLACPMPMSHAHVHVRVRCSSHHECC